MKKTNFITIVLIIVGLLLLGQYCFDIFCKRVPNGMVLVRQETVDSLKAYIEIADSLEKLAHLPPDTIKIIDTIYFDTLKIVVSDPNLEPDPDDSTITVVKDTLEVDGEISAWVEFKLKGELQSGIKWGYKPVIKENTIIIEKPVPYPVIKNVEIKVPSTGHYLSLTAGGNDKMFTFGMNYDLVQETKIYGVQYQRWGNQNIFGVKIGINLNTLFKK